jgi:hypothetical protein
MKVIVFFGRVLVASGVCKKQAGIVLPIEGSSIVMQTYGKHSFARSSFDLCPLTIHRQRSPPG